MDTYQKIVIGSIEQLPVSAQRPNGALIDLSDIPVTVRIVGPGASGPVVVADATCTTSATGGVYNWDTTGLTEGRYYIQFTLDFGDVYAIKPSSTLSVLLAARLGGP